MNANGYRLPTEAEWEYSCRIDSMTLFFWGNDPSLSSEYAWTRENCDTIQKVALKQPNGFRLYDLAGNVWEWCNDWFDPDYYSSSPQLNAYGPESGDQRVIRGGSWKHSLYFAQAGTRSKMSPDVRSGTIGFRTVRVVK
jgi:formylglycine-generating enzyme required for sulfatase activity